MKFVKENRTRMVSRTIGGTTHEVEENYQVPIPKLPRDLDQLAIRTASGLVLALTLIAVVWSTVSIGALLHGGVGYGAAVLFDLSWLVNILLEWLARFDQSKRGFAKKFGWALLGITMGAILWHGFLVGSTALAVVGAVVSLVAKTLWMGIMRFIDRDLSDVDRQWVEAEMSKANAQLAIAGVRRQAARAENRAALELLAAQRIRSEITALSGPQVEVLEVEEVEAPAESATLAQIAEPVPAIAPALTPSALAELVAALSGPLSAAVSARLSGREDEPEPVRADKVVVRPAATTPLFRAPEMDDAVRPDESGRPQVEPEDEQEESPMTRFLVPSGPTTTAEVVRELLNAGMDPKAMPGVVPALLGREVNQESVRREIRRQVRVIEAESGGVSDDPFRVGEFGPYR